jgi:hypothetical protein
MFHVSILPRDGDKIWMSFEELTQVLSLVIKAPRSVLDVQCHDTGELNPQKQQDNVAGSKKVTTENPVLQVETNQRQSQPTNCQEKVNLKHRAVGWSWDQKAVSRTWAC